MAVLPYLCRPKSVFADFLSYGQDPVEQIELLNQSAQAKASAGETKTGK
jgi:hypothetical protein